MSTEQLRYAVGGMHCASCVARLEKALTKVDGVTSAQVNLAMEEALLEVDASRFDAATIASRRRRSRIARSLPRPSVHQS